MRAMSNENHWERILNPETMLYVIEMGKREFGDDEDNLGGDEEKHILAFFEVLKEKTDYKSVVVMATQWITFSEAKQVALSIETVGEYNASRYMMLLDFLAYRFMKGKL